MLWGATSALRCSSWSTSQSVLRRCDESCGQWDSGLVPISFVCSPSRRMFVAELSFVWEGMIRRGGSIPCVIRGRKRHPSHFEADWSRIAWRWRERWQVDHRKDLKPTAALANESCIVLIMHAKDTSRRQPPATPFERIS